jgi:hypothetical protein
MNPFDHIIVTVRDMGRLTEVLRDVRREPRSVPSGLGFIESALRRADLVASSFVPPDVITKNSRSKSWTRVRMPGRS